MKNISAVCSDICNRVIVNGRLTIEAEEMHKYRNNRPDNSMAVCGYRKL